MKNQSFRKSTFSSWSVFLSPKQQVLSCLRFLDNVISCGPEGVFPLGCSDSHYHQTGDKTDTSWTKQETRLQKSHNFYIWIHLPFIPVTSLFVDSQTRLFLFVYHWVRVTTDAKETLPAVPAPHSQWEPSSLVKKALRAWCSNNHDGCRGSRTPTTFRENYKFSPGLPQSLTDKYTLFFFFFFMTTCLKHLYVQLIFLRFCS